MRRRVPPDTTPKITLANVLKRRRMNLAGYVKESGVATYGALLESCRRIGVIPPTQAEYDRVAAEGVSIPTEGIVVLPPPPVIAESTGAPIDPEVQTESEPEIGSEISMSVVGRRSRKKSTTDDQHE